VYYERNAARVEKEGERADSIPFVRVDGEEDDDSDEEGEDDDDEKQNKKQKAAADSGESADFPPGARVWAKIGRYQYWPAAAIGIDQVADEKSRKTLVAASEKKNAIKGAVLVMFFKSRDVSWIKPNCICVFDGPDSAPDDGKRGAPDFEEALIEAAESDASDSEEEDDDDDDGEDDDDGDGDGADADEEEEEDGDDAPSNDAGRRRDETDGPERDPAVDGGDDESEAQGDEESADSDGETDSETDSGYDGPEPKRRKKSTTTSEYAAGTTTSGYVGVFWNKINRKWRAGIAHNGKSQNLGDFDDERKAARAFDTAARRQRGENAHGGRAAGANRRCRRLN
jgi:hypothetical protein